MNVNEIGSLAMELMELLGESASERGYNDVHVSQVAIVVAYDATSAEGQTFSGVRYRANTSQFWATRGLLLEAADMVSAGNR